MGLIVHCWGVRHFRVSLGTLTFGNDRTNGASVKGLTRILSYIKITSVRLSDQRTSQLGNVWGYGKNINVNSQISSGTIGTIMHQLGYVRRVPLIIKLARLRLCTRLLNVDGCRLLRVLRNTTSMSLQLPRARRVRVKAIGGGGFR